jgi:putative CocE/NonD family hydrolase
VRVADGTRLATALYRPAEGEPRATVFARSVAPLRAPRQPTALMARLLAEQGHRVVVQQCRGLQSSEGRFDPFLADGEDGADTLDWLAAQPGSGGPIVLTGLGYAGHAAWATLAAARQPIDGLLVGFAARDPYRWLHTGGALELENCFDLALALAAAEPEGVRTRDLARAVRHRPLCDADRVAARRIDWLRAWLEHPHPDRYWEERTAPLPASPPKTLLIAGAYHPTSRGMLEDYAALASAAEIADVARPQLLIGPWSAGAQTRRERPKDARLAREIARATVAHLDSVCEDGGRATAPVRYYVGGGRGWREAFEWPPTAQEQVLFLDGDGRSAEGGRLAAEPPVGDVPPDRYVYDPADAVPSEGGASLSHPGAITLRETEARGDVLRYLGEPLPRDCELSGVVRVEIFAASDAPQTDFTARLSRIDEGGASTYLCDGIARAEPGGEKPSRVVIELAPACFQLRAGERLRLDVSSSSFPRFDRHPNIAEASCTENDRDCRAALQRIHHDAEHPSCLRLALVE